MESRSTQTTSELDTFENYKQLLEESFMDIIERGAIGVLMGGVAIIGSLIYAGLPDRQSNVLTARSRADTKTS